MKIVFLYGNFEKDIYMEKLEGSKSKLNNNLFDERRKLYASSRRHNNNGTRGLILLWRRMYILKKIDHCVSVEKLFNGGFIILLLYVDDILIVGHDTKKIENLKKELRKSFTMKNLDPSATNY